MSCNEIRNLLVPLTSGLFKCDEVYSSSIQTAQLLCHHIKSDISSMYSDKDKCSLSNLLGYSPDEWLSQRPKALVRLLRELCGYKESLNEK